MEWTLDQVPLDQARAMVESMAPLSALACSV